MNVDQLLAAGGIIGAGFVVLYSAVKVIDKFLGNGKNGRSQQVVAACPLNADPEVRGLIAKQTEIMTTLLSLATKQIDIAREGQSTVAAVLNKSVDLLNEIRREGQIDHARLDMHVEEARRAIDGLRSGDPT